MKRANMETDLGDTGPLIMAHLVADRPWLRVHPSYCCGIMRTWWDRGIGSGMSCSLRRHEFRNALSATLSRLNLDRVSTGGVLDPGDLALRELLQLAQCDRGECLDVIDRLAEFFRAYYPIVLPVLLRLSGDMKFSRCAIVRAFELNPGYLVKFVQFVQSLQNCPKTAAGNLLWSVLRNGTPLCGLRFLRHNTLESESEGALRLPFDMTSTIKQWEHATYAACDLDYRATKLTRTWPSGSQ